MLGRTETNLLQLPKDNYIGRLKVPGTIKVILKPKTK
jgi:hypothetical protein